MRKAYYLITIPLLYFLFLACGQTIKPIDFCEILRRDQSYVNNNKSDKNYKTDKATRTKILDENFDLLMQHIEQEGLPRMEAYESDSCLQWAVQMTIMHAAQGNQKELFAKKI